MKPKQRTRKHQPAADARVEGDATLIARYPFTEKASTKPIIMMSKRAQRFSKD